MRAPKNQLFVFAAPLLAWYDKKGRALPWRHRWPDLAPAYDVLLSELMLQQTVVATVIPYFLRFKELFPTITDLAYCDDDVLMREWAGLGYYARARNLKKAALAVIENHDGIFPTTEKDLLNLPGVGPYTAAAIQAFAFDQPAIVLDGNVERVMARFLAIETQLPALKQELRTHYPDLQPQNRHSDFAQAIMDLGASICISGRPRCEACPLSGDCASAFSDLAETLPRKAPKKPKPKRNGVVFVALSGDKAVMKRRGEKGLLGGMMGFPTAGWQSKDDAPSGLADAPFDADWQKSTHEVHHVFTHFALRLEIYIATNAIDQKAIDQKQAEQAGYALVQPDQAGLPTLFQKVWDKVKIAQLP